MIIPDARGKPVRYSCRRAPAPPGGFALTLVREDGTAEYIVTFDGRGWRCTCPCFAFSRGAYPDKHVAKCKEIKQLLEELACPT